jgi:hypothetical protein
MLPHVDLHREVFLVREVQDLSAQQLPLQFVDLDQHLREHLIWVFQRASLYLRKCDLQTNKNLLHRPSLLRLQQMVDALRQKRIQR